MKNLNEVPTEELQTLERQMTLVPGRRRFEVVFVANRDSHELRTFRIDWRGNVRRVDRADTGPFV